MRVTYEKVSALVRSAVQKRIKALEVRWWDRHVDTAVRMK
jgi:hypothetical protein